MWDRTHYGYAPLALAYSGHVIAEAIETEGVEGIDAKLDRYRGVRASARVDGRHSLWHETGASSYDVGLSAQLDWDLADPRQRAEAQRIVDALTAAMATGAQVQARNEEEAADAAAYARLVAEEAADVA